jgi:hypothetical protein
VGAEVEVAVRDALQEWERGGAAAIQAVVWKFDQPDQIRVCTELYNENALDALAACIRDEMVHDMRRSGIPGLGTYRGPSGYRRFLAEWREAFPASRLEIESLESAGDHHLVIYLQHVEGGEGHVPLTFEYGAIISGPGRHATRSEFYTDVQRARDRFSALAAEAPA